MDGRRPPVPIMAARWIVPLVVVIIVGAGCGSSGVHSATHVYSVQQVEAAFAAHGIKLRKAQRQPLSRVVALDGTQRDGAQLGVLVAATVRLANPTRLVPGLVNSRGPRAPRKHGNAVVVALPSSTVAVNAALADLH